MKMKKLVSLLLAVITVFSMLQVTAFAETRGSEPDDTGMEEFEFSDVPSDSWAYPAVMWAYNNGITAGMGDGTFGLDVTVTRAQAVTFLWAYFGKPEPKTQNNPFTDVETTEWYYKPVLWAVENHIAAGTGGNSFSPNNQLTNAQIITMLHAMAGKPKVSGNIHYTNVSQNDYYYNALVWGVKKNLFDERIPTGYYEKENGSGSGRKPLKSFGYNWGCTRGLFVELLYNYNFMYSDKTVRIDLRNATERMVQIAVAEKGNSTIWNEGRRYGGFGKDDKTGIISPWCAAFVSWCGMMSGLADKNDKNGKSGYYYISDRRCTWGGLDPSDSDYAYPVLRNRECFNMMDQFMRNEHLFLSKNVYDYMSSSSDADYQRFVKGATQFSDSFMPRRGDVIFFMNDATGFTGAHVGIVTDVTPHEDGTVTIYTVEGNSSNSVAGNWYTMELATGHVTEKSDYAYYNTITGFGRIR